MTTRPSRTTTQRDSKPTATRAEWSRRKLARRYNAKLPDFERLEAEARFILREACSPYGDRVYSVKSRIKTLESVAQKAKRKQLVAPLDDMFDCVGFRVVCLYKSDLAALRATIEASFRVVEVDDKATDQSDPSVFEYESIHFKVLLPATCGGPRYAGITIEPFEIQLRTLAMDSWATISHNLSYEKGWEIPEKLQRDFHAVAALLHLADKHFDDVYRYVNKQKAAATAALATGKPRLQKKVSPYSVSAYLAWRFPDRSHARDASVGEFSQSLLSHGVRTLGALNRLVNSGLEAALSDEQQVSDKPGAGDSAYHWWDLALARAAVRKADPAFEADDVAREHKVNRLAALESMPVPFEVFKALVASLDEEPSVVAACDGTNRRTLGFLSGIPGIDVDATIAWLKDFGGYCDCEVLYNVASLFSAEELE
jgi:putative GTP pyrophosphokinase